MYTASVLEVLIASPSDTSDQRAAIRHAVFDWNKSNARASGVALLPVMWETDTYPELGQPAQAIINKQIVDDADILIATFWTSLGSPTRDAESGTIEEIDRFVVAGKPVLVYFCETPAMVMSVDGTAIDAVKKYRQKLQGEGLYSSYGSTDELAIKVRDDLTRRIREMQESAVIASAPENAPSRDEDAERESSDLEPTRRFLSGYAAKWRAQIDGLEKEDVPSVDRRHELMEEVRDVVLEAQRLVSTENPDAPILLGLMKISSEAARFAVFRVYIDGGRSFNELDEGCRNLVNEVEALTRDPKRWNTASS
jgi:hypothetical protein